jgi:FMN phosphatase YigB (HAD superfamily)
MVQAVVFDLGKVLLDFDYAIAARKIAARGKIPANDLTRFINHNPLVVRYETGLVSSEQFYREICALTGFRGDITEFGDLFSSIFAPIEPMIQLHAALHQRGMPTYIFSNTNEMVVQYIRRAFPFFANFDGYILSYEHHVMKPDARLYEVIERQSGRRDAEILYLDDRPENIAAGAARGWQTILHESPQNSIAAIEKLGLSNH